MSKTIAFNDGALNATSRLHYWKGLRNPFRELIGGDKMTHCKFFSVKLHRAFQTLEITVPGHPCLNLSKNQNPTANYFNPGKNSHPFNLILLEHTHV